MEEHFYDPQGNRIASGTCVFSTVCPVSKQTCPEQGRVLALTNPYWCLVHPRCFAYFPFDGQWPHQYPRVFYDREHDTPDPSPAETTTDNKSQPPPVEITEIKTDLSYDPPAPKPKRPRGRPRKTVAGPTESSITVEKEQPKTKTKSLVDDAAAQELKIRLALMEAKDKLPEGYGIVRVSDVELAIMGSVSFGMVIGYGVRWYFSR